MRGVAFWKAFNEEAEEERRQNVSALENSVGTLTPPHAFVLLYKENKTVARLARQREQKMAEEVLLAGLLGRYSSLSSSWQEKMQADAEANHEFKTSQPHDAMP